MWTLKVKDSNGVYESLDISQDAVVLDFEYLNAEKLQDRYANASWSFDIKKTAKNNHLIMLNLFQAYSINRTYIDCILSLDNQFPLGFNTKLQVLSQSADNYKCQVLSEDKAIFDELEKFGFNENNTIDSKYYNVLGFAHINTNNKTPEHTNPSYIVQNYPWLDVEKQESIKAESLLKPRFYHKYIYPDKISNFSLLSFNQTFYNNKYVQFDYNGLLSAIFAKIGIKFNGANTVITEGDKKYACKVELAPKFKKYHLPHYIINSNYSEDLVDNPNKTVYIKINNKFEFTVNRDQYLNSNNDYFISPSAIITFKTNLDENGREIEQTPIDWNETLDDGTVVFHQGVFPDQKEQFFNMNVQGKTAAGATVNTWITSNTIAEGVVDTLWNVISGDTEVVPDGSRKTTGYKSNYKYWYKNADGTHQLTIILSDNGYIWRSETNCPYSFTKANQDPTKITWGSTQDPTVIHNKMFSVIMRYFKGNYLIQTNARIQNVVGGDFCYAIQPNIVAQGYKVTPNSGLTNGIGEYTGNGYVSIQDVIGFKNAKELFLAYLRALGCYYKVSYDDSGKILTCSFPSATTSSSIKYIEINKFDYSLDKKYNNLSYITTNKQRTWYYDYKENTQYYGSEFPTLDIQEFWSNNQLLDTKYILSYINNPKYNNTEENELYHLDFSPISEVVAVDRWEAVGTGSEVSYYKPIRHWDVWDTVPLIPYDYNSDALESDGLLIMVYKFKNPFFPSLFYAAEEIMQHSWTGYLNIYEWSFKDFGLHQKTLSYIYSNFCKLEFVTLVEDPDDYVGKVVYINQLGLLVFINKISKWTGYNKPCTLEGYIWQPIDNQ